MGAPMLKICTKECRAARRRTSPSVWPGSAFRSAWRRAFPATHPAGVVEVPAFPVEVVDTVGAGDAYMSALLAGLHDRHLLGAAARADLRAIAPDTLATVLTDAARAAAVTCGRRGSDPPTRAELATPASVR